MTIISMALSLIGFGWGIALGLLVGYFMLIYFEPDDVKAPQLTHLDKFDFEALQAIFPEIPLWIKSPDWEKVDWLNTFMQVIWPYVDKAACKQIREIAEPYITEYKPKYNLDAVEFDSLTLGTQPPVFMGVKTHETPEKELIFEAAMKFAGNPNIKVAVKAYGMRAAAQVVDTQVFATARITLKPLFPVFPCFSGICISLMEKPHVDFGLRLFNADLMGIPGVSRYVQGMLTTIISKMILWPNKLEIPVATDIQVTKQAQGVLAVTLMKGEHLTRKDVMGKSDPYVKLKVASSSKKSKVIMHNLNPVWNENFNLVVDDPECDSLDISVFDWDKVGSHDKLGVQSIPLKELTPDVGQIFTLKLLKNFDPNDPKNRKDRGRITLQLQYSPFEGNQHKSADQLDTLQHTDSGLGRHPGSMLDDHDSISGVIPPSGCLAAGGGLLVVIIHKAEDLEGKHHTNPYATVIFRGEQKTSKIVKKNRDPKWDAEFEYLLNDSPIKDRLLVEIRSKGRSLLSHKESLGRVEIALLDVVKNRRINEKFKLLDSKNGRVHVELQWRTTGAISPGRNLTVTQGPHSSAQGSQSPAFDSPWKATPER